MAVRGIACCSKCDTSVRIVMQVPAFKLLACVSRPDLNMGYLNKRGCTSISAGSSKLLKPTPTRRKRCRAPRFTLSRRSRAISVSSSQVDGGEGGVWLRVRILKPLVLSLRTTVRPIRVSLREAAQTLSARRRIIGSVSTSGRSCSKVSSADMDLVCLSGTTSLGSTPRASS